jgi:hypothetical protein
MVPRPRNPEPRHAPEYHHKWLPACFLGSRCASLAAGADFARADPLTQMILGRGVPKRGRTDAVRYTCRAISRSALANRVSSCFL